MPLVRINAHGDHPVPVDDLGAALGSIPAGAPVIVLIHGYKYAPEHPCRCPHQNILSLDPRASRRAISWPRHLGFGKGDPAEGLCISFGWNACGTIWQADAEARRVGRVLAEVIRTVRTAPASPVHVMGHSLGARVALSAFPHLPAGAIGRALLLTGAETRDAAELALATPAGSRAEVINVLTRENMLFDLLYRASVRPHRPCTRTLGAGLGRDDPRWLDLAIDSPCHRATLARAGFRIPQPARAVCHWSAYLRPGIFAFYRALLRENLPLNALRSNNLHWQTGTDEPLASGRQLFGAAIDRAGVVSGPVASRAARALLDALPSAGPRQSGDQPGVSHPHPGISSRRCSCSGSPQARS